MIRVEATDRARIGQTVTLEIYAYSNVIANTPGTSIKIFFDVSVTNPCPFTTINPLTVPLVTMDYVVAASAAVQNFDAVTNSKAELT